MKELAGTPQEPMHLLPPWLGPVLVLLTLGLAAWLFFRFIRPWYRARRASRAAARSPVGKAARSFDAVLEALAERAHGSGDYRGGLFELNAQLKAWLAQKTGAPILERSSVELGKVAGFEKEAALVADLEAVSCSAEEPGRKAFDARHRAVAALAKERASKGFPIGAPKRGTA